MDTEKLKHWIWLSMALSGASRGVDRALEYYNCDASRIYFNKDREEYISLGVFTRLELSRL